MKTNIYINLLGGLLTLCLFVSFAQGLEPTQAAGTQEVSASPDDKIYPANKVDTKAVIDQSKKAIADREPEVPSSCEKGEGTVRLRMVLHKTGKVTDVVVVKKSPCGDFDSKAKKAARRVKFTPARKGGVAVSQYIVMEFSYRIWVSH